MSAEIQYLVDSTTPSEELSGYTPEQETTFKELIQRVNRKEISMNQAYNIAVKPYSGFSNVFGENAFGTTTSWGERAQDTSLVGDQTGIIYDTGGAFGSNAGAGFKGKFKDFINKAKDKGWLDKGMDVLGILSGRRDAGQYGGGYPSPKDVEEARKKRRNTMIGVGVGVALIITAVVIYQKTKKD